MHLSGFVETAQVPSMPSQLPLHEHGHVVAVVLWKNRVTRHNVSKQGRNRNYHDQCNKLWTVEFFYHRSGWITRDT